MTQCLFPRRSGTGGYQRGCRCARCRDAKSAYRARPHWQRLPWDPIQHLLTGRGAATKTAMAALLGVERTYLYRWAENGLTVDAADKVACTLGLHPALIWPDYYEKAAA